MATKIKLQDDFSPPASIFGIISDLPDHRLCYILNNELGLRLCRTPTDKELHLKAGKILFSEFYYYEPVSMIPWRLTSNTGGYLFSEELNTPEKAAVPLVQDLKTMNYFLWYEEERHEEIHRFIFTRLRSNPYIRAIHNIDQANSKHIENLLFET